MNKGFTLIELLAVLLILGVISGIAVFSYNDLVLTSKNDYYRNLKNNIKLAASEYFASNRTKRPGIFDVCNTVPLKELVNEKLMRSITDVKGYSCDLTNSLLYIKRKENGGYEYNVSLICGNDRFLIDEEAYCSKKHNTSSTILLSATDSLNNNYILNAPYKLTKWVKGSVKVKFTSTIPITKYVITNTYTNDIYTCNTINSECIYELKKHGVYNVATYNNDEKVSNSDFNIKIDNDKPIFDLKNTGNYNIEDGKNLIYKNSLVNIHDTSGIDKINYKLSRENRLIVQESVNINNIVIKNLVSGKYKMELKVYDMAGNESEILVHNFYITRNIKLIDLNNDKYKQVHQIVDGMNYNFINELPVLHSEGKTFLGWSMTNIGSNYVTNNTRVNEQDNILYARWS